MKFRNAIFYPQEINDQTESFFFLPHKESCLNIFGNFNLNTKELWDQFDNKKCIIIISTIKK